MTLIVWFSVLALVLLVVPYLYWSWREQSARPAWLRTSFWGGISLFMGLFVVLTWHTLSVMPQRTHAQNLNPDVIAGKEAWQKNVCVNCHTILGNGAYYGPDLTRAWNRFLDRAGGDERAARIALVTFLKNPPGPTRDRRGMVKPPVQQADAESLAAFLRWVSEIDTSGWPPQPLRPVRAVAPPATSSDTDGRRLLVEHGCEACHSVGGGAVIGPDLAAVGNKYSREQLVLWLTNTDAIYAHAGRRPLNPGFPEMPNQSVDPREADLIVGYLTAERSK